jgi:hypothetical protein
MDGEGSEPTRMLGGREALTPVFEDLDPLPDDRRFTTADDAVR